MRKWAIESVQKGGETEKIKWKLKREHISRKKKEKKKKKAGELKYFYIMGNLRKRIRRWNGKKNKGGNEQ